VAGSGSGFEAGVVAASGPQAESNSPTIVKSNKMFRFIRHSIEFIFYTPGGHKSHFLFNGLLNL